MVSELKFSVPVKNGFKVTSQVPSFSSFNIMSSLQHFYVPIKSFDLDLQEYNNTANKNNNIKLKIFISIFLRTVVSLVLHISYTSYQNYNIICT